MVVGSFAIAGSDEQKAAGIADSPDLFYQDLVNVCGADSEVARAYADNQIDAYRMLKEEGIKFPGILHMPAHNRNRGLGWLSGLGPKMVKALEDRARRTGVEILFRHRATRLITDPQTGRVIGVKVNVGDETKDFKARRAVIIASGGFGRNREMIAEYCPEMVETIPLMPPSHLGDGLKMGLAAGAATKDIGIAVAPSWSICTETHSNSLFAANWGAIMVNMHGKRFHNESCIEGFYGPLTGDGLRQPGGIYWVILNDNVKAEGGKIGTAQQISCVEKCQQLQADTIEELASIAGIDARGLKETVAKYNSDIDNIGYDTVFGRKFLWGSEGTLVKLDTPRFYAIRCQTSITSLKGGLKINGRSQVVNQYGAVIPGLYAAGEVTGGLHTKTYLLGVMTAGSMTQGIIAGKNAAREAAGQ